jgi:hypothetical protein
MANLEYSRIMAVGEAEHLWDLFGFSSPKDLVLEDLALARNVVVTEGPLEKMEARLIRQGKHGLIRVRNDIAEVGRRRFAIAHELGHWELHQRVSQLFACTGDDMVAAYKASVVEAEANYFASGLLMPTSLFSQKSTGKVLSVTDISELSYYFCTSFTATAIQYVDLSSETCAVVASSAGKIRWWRGSPDFESQFWIAAQSPLSPNTVAGSIFRGGARPAGPVEVDIAEWSDRGANEDSDTFFEECVVMEHYGHIVSLLRLP